MSREPSRDSAIHTSVVPAILSGRRGRVAGNNLMAARHYGNGDGSNNFRRGLSGCEYRTNLGGFDPALIDTAAIFIKRPNQSNPRNSAQPIKSLEHPPRVDGVSISDTTRFSD
ncbi:hypothetical protein RRG08_014866 [Elysia crispata]|uniref:Uncharacterized protein n=1 Tax=Elysia crispata TaxID=231223 RepID=A0AAE1E1E1_9GAST|nr:hypothetical protein RRG08_014866 [Elysia crispata]